jgi:putative flippase GtrA
LSRSSATVVREPPEQRSRAHRALRARHNWVQLAKFCTVGGSGYVVNLGVYTLLLDRADLHYRLAATGSFLVAASWNYWWNRHWTFRGQRGHFAYQGHLGLLSLLVYLGVGKIVAQAIAVVLVTPLNFLGNKLWSFRR